jgi:hypothetical protein
LFNDFNEYTYLGLGLAMSHPPHIVFNAYLLQCGVLSLNLLPSPLIRYGAPATITIATAREECFIGDSTTTTIITTAITTTRR